MAAAVRNVALATISSCSANARSFIAKVASLQSWMLRLPDYQSNRVDACRQPFLFEAGMDLRIDQSFLRTQRNNAGIALLSCCGFGFGPGFWAGSGPSEMEYGLRLAQRGNQIVDVTFLVPESPGYLGNRESIHEVRPQRLVLPMHRRRRCDEQRLQVSHVTRSSNWCADANCSHEAMAGRWRSYWPICPGTGFHESVLRRPGSMEPAGRR